ncbi:hypothetical protein KKB18_00465, partial [bacterium]|nr:hypothetical protein [bacterium]
DLSYSMTLSSSSAGVSTYTYSTSLQKGNHNYFFLATDIHDSVGRLPASPQYFDGPFVLQSPILSDSTIDPEIGNESTEFTFTVHYEDTEGLPPRIKNIYVNNQPYMMELISGETYNGTYQAVINGFEIGVGFDNCYYFLFTNTVDAQTRFPKTGCISGPSVVAAAINMPFWQVRPGFDTLIVLNNIGTAPAQTTISLKNINGVEKFNKPYSIPARGQETISLSKETNFLNNYGYGEITWTSGSLMVWGVIFNNYNGSAFPIHFDLPRLSPIYIPYYNFDVVYKSVDSGIFLTNLSNVIANGYISFYSGFGQLFKRRAISIQPGMMEIIFASKENIPNGEGYAKVEWDQGVLTIFEAVYNTEEASGFTVPCYPPFTSRVEISNWKRFQGPACALSLTEVPPSDFYKLPTIAFENPDIYDASENASYSMPSLTIDDFSEQELLNPYSVQALDAETPTVEKAPAPTFLPVLSNGGVDPIEGDQNRLFIFSVNYSDQDGDIPPIKNLVLDGFSYQMNLASGIPSNGKYSLTKFDLDIGTHRFYFEFADGNDGDVRYPAFGSLVGPIVADPSTFCWDTVFYITNTGSVNEHADVTMTFNNANGSKNGTDVVIHGDGFPGTYTKIIRLSDYPNILDGIGNGYITWDGPPLLIFAKVENPVLDKSYTLEFNPPHDETVYIPAWMAYSDAGVTTQLYITNKSTQAVAPLLTLFSSTGSIRHTEPLAPIASGATGIVDLSQYFGTGLNFGSGYLTWDDGSLDIYGHIINQVTNQYYLLNFDRPRIQ